MIQEDYPNHQIVTIAVYLLGGDSRYVDTEDVAIRVNEIAPNRFVWRKYRQQINIENVRTFLSDAKKEKNGAFLIGSGKAGWLLTERGIKFAKKNVKKLADVDLSKDRLTYRDRQYRQNERLRLLTSKAYQKSQESGMDTVTADEIKAFFRIDDYVSDRAKELKVKRVLNLFSEDPELGDIVKILSSKVDKE